MGKVLNIIILLSILFSCLIKSGKYPDINLNNNINKNIIDTLPELIVIDLNENYKSHKMIKKNFGNYYTNKNSLVFKVLIINNYKENLDLKLTSSSGTFAPFDPNLYIKANSKSFTFYILDITLRKGKINPLISISYKLKNNETIFYSKRLTITLGSK